MQLTLTYPSPLFRFQNYVSDGLERHGWRGKRCRTGCAISACPLMTWFWKLPQATRRA